jgi:hypothetical protein
MTHFEYHWTKIPRNFSITEKIYGLTLKETIWEIEWHAQFHFQNIKLFISLRGFRYFKKVIHQILRENDAKDASLDVGKETTRTVDIIINGMRSRGVTSMEILGNLEERQSVMLCLLTIVIHVYNNNNNNNLFLRSWPSQHTKLVYETPLFVGQGTPSAQRFDW